MIRSVEALETILGRRLQLLERVHVNVQSHWEHVHNGISLPDARAKVISEFIKGVKNSQNIEKHIRQSRRV